MGNPVASALASAHKALDKANKDFPSPSYKMAHQARKEEPTAAPAAPTTGDELKVKSDNIANYVKATDTATQ